jgi:hypothetical protein
MGATVLCNKAAQAMTVADGTTRYVCWESSYEKNCHPHTPSWCAMAWGTYDEVMRSIIGRSSSTEGGSLQSRRGYIFPENYIAHWRQTLAKPTRLTAPESVSLDWSAVNSGWHMDKESEEKCRMRRVAEVIAKLDPVEDAHWIDALNRWPSKPLTFSPTRAFRLLDGLAQSRAIYLWKLFSSFSYLAQPFDVPTASTASVLELAQPTIALPMVWRIDRENRIVSYDQGRSWSQPNWPYSLVGAFIQERLMDAELRQPGIAKRVLPALRNQLNSAELVPDEAKLVIYPDRIPEHKDAKWRRDDVVRLADCLGRKVTDGAWHLTFAELTKPTINETATYQFRNLVEEQVEWISFGSSHRTSLNGHTVSVSREGIAA